MNKEYRGIIHCAALLLLGFMFSACGGSSGSTSPTSYESAQTATYKVEYIPVTPAQEGKSEVKVRVTDKVSGAVYTDRTVVLTPNMAMTAGYSHGTPFSAVTNNNDGTYSVTIYYSMASKNADGTALGDWDLTFNVNGENAKFYPVVARSAVTARRALKGVADSIPGMSGPSKRNYLLFSEGISGTSVKLYIAAVDNQMMTLFPAISTGTILHDANSNSWIANPVSVELSTDNSNWISASAGANPGQWVATVSGMTAGGSLYAKLTINGEQKTTDGSIVGAANGYQTFTVTP